MLLKVLNISIYKLIVTLLMFCFLHGYVCMISFRQATRKSVTIVETSEIV